MPDKNQIIQLRNYCHRLADLLDAETRLINKKQITDLETFVKKKSDMATSMAKISDNFDEVLVYENYPELKFARSRLASSVKRNHITLAKSKNLLEALMRHIAKKVNYQNYNKNIYNQKTLMNKQNSINKQNSVNKQNIMPVACNKIS